MTEKIPQTEYKNESIEHEIHVKSVMSINNLLNPSINTTNKETLIKTNSLINTMFELQKTFSSNQQNIIMNNFNSNKPYGTITFKYTPPPKQYQVRNWKKYKPKTQNKTKFKIPHCAKFSNKSITVPKSITAPKSIIVPKQIFNL